MGFYNDAGALIVSKDGRTVLTTAGRLIRLLPTVLNFSRSATFPTFVNHDIGYRWDHSQTLQSLNTDGSSTYRLTNSGICYATVPSQDLEVPATIMAAPAGADVFFGRARLTRTAAPPSTWYGKPVDCLVKQGQWMPWFGSTVVEEDIGFARAVHFCIEANNLTLTLEQSVSTNPEGWGSFGNNGSGTGSGYTIIFNTLKGIPAVVLGQTSDSATETTSGIVTPLTTCRKGGTAGASTHDTSNHASTYLFEAQGRFGRVIT